MRTRRLTAAAIFTTMLAAWLPASAGAAKGAFKKHFTEVLVGSRISTSGSRYENVYRVKQSPDGGGAAIQDAALQGSSYPVHAHDRMIAFFRNGGQTTSDTFIVGTPSTSGIGAISGNGTCLFGSGAHVKETCTFTIKGSYDLNTSVTNLVLSGTYTRPATKSKTK
jgi:hypothetical protein